MYAACRVWRLLWRALLAVAVVVRQDLFEQLRDVNAVLDRRVELESELRRELQVLQAPAELVPDQSSGRHKTLDRGLLLVGIAEHAHANAGRPQIWGHACAGDAHESDPVAREV